jgi:DNA-binding IclR family transcriptional regulator
MACNCIGGVMVNMLVQSEVDRGFMSQTDQTKHYKIGICCLSTIQAALSRNNSLYQFRIFLSDTEPTSELGIQISKKKKFKSLVYIEYLFNFLTEKVLKYYNNV